MGCNNSKAVPDTVVQPTEMKSVDNYKPLDKNSTSPDQNNGGSEKKGSAIAFEIPVDELKVPANQPSTANQPFPQEVTDPEQLAAELKAKEEQAEKNRQRELEKIQNKSAERDEQIKKAQERKKVSQSQNDIQSAADEAHNESRKRSQTSLHEPKSIALADADKTKAASKMSVKTGTLAEKAKNASKMSIKSPMNEKPNNASKASLANADKAKAASKMSLKHASNKDVTNNQ